MHAWLYCRASPPAHSLKGDHDLDLFAPTFRDPDAGPAFFAKQKWNFDDVEYTYLERSASPATAAVSRRYSVRTTPPGAARRSCWPGRARRRRQGNKDAAMGCVEVLLRLAPRARPGHDRLACLHYRRGDMERAVALLSGWQRLAPHDHWPLVRQAIIEQQRGNAERRAKAIDQALGLTNGAGAGRGRVPRRPAGAASGSA